MPPSESRIYANQLSDCSCTVSTNEHITIHIQQRTEKTDKLPRCASCLYRAIGPQFEAMYTVMNEYGQILTFLFLRDTSFTQLSSCFADIKDRYRRAGGTACPPGWHDGGNANEEGVEKGGIVVYGPLVFYTDSCCHEANILLQSFPHLRWRMRFGFDTQAINPASMASAEAAGKDDFTQHVNIVKVMDEGRIGAAIDHLRTTGVLGFDMEWK
eukprot:scaffold343548_cov17-Prasinocladus_malaysianus.AAC.2